MELNENTYYTKQSNLEYMSASQFKDFCKCEKEALAKVNEEYVKEPTKSMLVGSYVDAYFTDDFDKFKAEHPQIFKKEKGQPTNELLKDYESANETIENIKNDKVFMQFISGKHQVIMIGTISGIKFKIKIDSLLEDYIVDLKVMESIVELYWDTQDGRNVKVDFVEKFGYDIIGAIYQEVVRQNIGRKLPFILAVATKEEGTDKALIQIDQEYLDSALKLVKQKCARFNAIKLGIVEPSECGQCYVCRKDKKVQGIVSYKELFNKEEEQLWMKT